METWEYAYFIGLPIVLWVLFVIPAIASKRFFKDVYGGNKEYLSLTAFISLVPIFNAAAIGVVLLIVVVSISIEFLERILNPILPSHLKK